MSRCGSTSEIDVAGISREQRIPAATVERELNYLIQEGKVRKNGNWYAPTKQWLEALGVVG